MIVILLNKADPWCVKMGWRWIRRHRVPLLDGAAATVPMLDWDFQYLHKYSQVPLVYAHLISVTVTVALTARSYIANPAKVHITNMWCSWSLWIAQQLHTELPSSRKARRVSISVWTRIQNYPKSVAGGSPFLAIINDFTVMRWPFAWWWIALVEWLT